ncbi:MAG: AlpA family phage regulatory protein [Pseudomonadota bacterium]
MSKSLLRIKSVQAKTDLSKAYIYQLIKLGKFPKQHRLPGKRVSVWLESEIDEWIDQQLSGEDA